MSLLTRASATALAFSLFVAGPVGAATRMDRARLAVHWLSHQQNEDGSFPGFSPIGSTADGILSFAAASTSPDDVDEAVAYLEANETEIDTIGEIAKVVTALNAAGRDPRNFAGRDLVDEIMQSLQDDGRFGPTTEVHNHALALIALRAADGENPENAVNWLLQAQCRDGGWEFQDPSDENVDGHCNDGSDDDFFESETDTTALAVMALTGHKVWSKESSRNPFRFFRVRRDPVKNGWGYDRNFPLTSSNSTALVIEAYETYGKDLPDGALKALIKLEYRLCGDRAGAFAFTYDQEDGRYKKQPPDVGATIGSILGLIPPRPYDAMEITEPPPEPSECRKAA